MKLLITVVSSVLLLTLLPGAPLKAHGTHKKAISSDYNSRIIDDSVFTQDNTMTVSSIQAFLNAKVPVCQSGYTCLKDYTQGGKTAAQIIYQAAQDYNLNPRVILVTLQKEQSLITDDWPVSAQYRTAMGYGCPESESTCNSEYYGFTNQVRLGTKLLRVGVDRNCGEEDSYPGWDISDRWRLGNTTTVDGKSTIIGTCATGSLYNYTPHRPDSAYLQATDGNHYYGNYNFIYFFSNWFGSTTSNIISINCSGNKYIVEPFIRAKRGVTEEALNAWGMDTLFFQPGGNRCSYPTYSLQLERLIRSRDTGKVYFVDRQNAWRVQDQSVANAWSLGSINQDFPQLNGETIQFLTVRARMPRLAKSDNGGKVYLIDGGSRHYVQGTPEDSDSLALIRGYNQYPVGTFSAGPDGYLSNQDNLSVGEAIDFQFKVGSRWYLFDHGKVRKIHPDHQYRWEGASLVGPSLGPSLSTAILNTWPEATTLDNGFRREPRYYVVSREGELLNTTSSSQARQWTVIDDPIITQLLTNKIRSYAE